MGPPFSEINRNPSSPSVVGDDWDVGGGGGGHNANQEEGIDWGRYLDALRRRKYLVLAIAVSVVAVSALVTFRQPKLYQSAVSMVIETSTPRVLTGVEEIVDVGAAGWVPESFYETEYQVMQSRAVARAAGEHIGIVRDDAHNGLAGITDPAEKAARMQALDPADLVQPRYSVEPDKKSSVVRIHVVDQDPKFCADLANAVAEAYVDKNLEKRIDGTRDASTWLAAQHADLKKKLEATEDLLYKFMEENDVLNASLESQLEEVKQRLQAFNASLAEQQAERIRYELDAQALNDVKSNPALIDTLREVQDAPLIGQLKSRIVELKALQLELSAKYQPDHPRMKIVADQIATTQKDLSKEIEAVIVGLERKKDSQENTVQGLKRALVEERNREARLNKLSLDYLRLKREVDTNAKLYDMVTSRMKEADITSALPFNNVRILDAALVPTSPFKPNLRQNLLVGLVFGLLLGIACALVLDVLDNTVKSQEDIEGTLEAPFLGLLPLIGANAPHRTPADEQRATQQRDLWVLREPKSASAECARFIRTNLVFMSPDKPLRTLVVTSPSPREGKTTTAISIAITMAQAGSRTLIVDTDLRRPRLHRVFDIDADVGLSSIIVGEATLDQAIKRTEVPNLDVLVCGPLPPNPAELLHTARFTQTLRELSERYDRVIFDTPPVGPVTDPVILAAQVDGTIVVVKCEKTTKDMAKQALRSIRDAQGRVLGVILNDVDVTAKRYSRVYYSYHRRYGGYYGSEAKEKEQAKKSAKEAA